MNFSVNSPLFEKISIRQRFSKCDHRINLEDMKILAENWLQPLANP
jgi:hypothetical protein